MISKLVYFLRDKVTNLRYKLLLRLYPTLKLADKIYTHLTKEDKIKLFRLASTLKDKFALEIGSYLGASACFISAGLKGNSKLICVDTWKNEGMTEGLRDTYEEFLRNTAYIKDKIIIVRGYSYDVIEEVKKITEHISLLFIDGDHSYEAVKKDWELYSPLLESGGYIAFHDIGWAEGVKKVVEEDVKPQLLKYCQLPNLFWGIKK